jgi:hypothetical protein
MKQCSRNTPWSLEEQSDNHALLPEPPWKRLPALEQNIIRHRAMEMVLALFYAEDLRKTIVWCGQAADRMRSHLNDNADQPEDVPTDGKKPLQKALKALVADNILSANERIEIKKLIDYRNVIAHRLEELNADVGHTIAAKDFVRFGPANRPKYDYDAVKRLCFYLQLLPNRTRSKYIQQLSMAPLLFETTEKALRLGLRRLRRTIDRQLAARKLENAELEGELSLDGTGLTDDLHPCNPYNRYESGNLTARGVEVCYRLFDFAKSPMAVAHFMQISLTAAIKRKRMWEALGGNNRERHDFNAMKIRAFYRTHGD